MRMREGRMDGRKLQGRRKDGNGEEERKEEENGEGWRYKTHMTKGDKCCLKRRK